MKRAIAIVLVAMQLAGCYTWQSSSMGPDARPVLPTTAERVRVHTRDGRTLELVNAAAHGDSLEANIVHGGIADDTTIARSDIAGVEVRKTDTGTVRGWVAVGTLGLVVAVLLMYDQGTRALGH